MPPALQELIEGMPYKFIDENGDYLSFKSQRAEIYRVLETLVFEKEATKIKMNGSSFIVTPEGWTKKDGITTLRASLKINNTSPVTTI